jgi:hypothetical protein
MCLVLEPRHCGEVAVPGEPSIESRNVPPRPDATAAQTRCNHANTALGAIADPALILGARGPRPNGLGARIGRPARRDAEISSAGVAAGRLGYLPKSPYEIAAKSELGQAECLQTATFSGLGGPETHVTYFRLERMTTRGEFSHGICAGTGNLASSGFAT